MPRPFSTQNRPVYEQKILAVIWNFAHIDPKSKKHTGITKQKIVRNKAIFNAKTLSHIIYRFAYLDSKFGYLIAKFSYILI